MGIQSNRNVILFSALMGIGMAIFYLLIGTIFAYIVTQGLSQFFIANCSEDCYFRIFNIIFAAVALFSFAGGIWSGIRTYRRKSERA